MINNKLPFYSSFDPRMLIQYTRSMITWLFSYVSFAFKTDKASHTTRTIFGSNSADFSRKVYAHSSIVEPTGSNMPKSICTLWEGRVVTVLEEGGFVAGDLVKLKIRRIK